MSSMACLQDLIGDEAYKQLVAETSSDGSGGCVGSVGSVGSVGTVGSVGSVGSSGSLHSMTINEQIISISNGIDVLNRSLHSLVCEKYEDLLAQSTKIDTLEEVLKLIRSRIESLLTGVTRIRAKLLSPFGRICEQTVVLNRLQSTCDLLRRTIRVIHLTKRLDQTSLDETDPTLLARQVTKAAQYVSQIEAIATEDIDHRLNKVDVIKSDLKGVAAVRTRLLELAEQLLENGIRESDSNQMSAGLQVFFSLNVLNQKVREIRDRKEDRIRKAVKQAIDSSLSSHTSQTTHSTHSTPAKTSAMSGHSGPGRVVIPMTIAQNSSIRLALRQNMDSLIDEIFSTFTQMSQMFRIIGKKRDPVTNCCLADQLSGGEGEGSDESDGVMRFWSNVTKCLSEQLCKAANDSAVVRQSLETEYPNYLNSFCELSNRISRDPNLNHKQLNAEKVLRSAIQAFESAFLSRSLSLLFDSVNKVFADAKETSLATLTSLASTHSQSELNYATSVPSVEDIESIVRHISQELHVSRIDPTLCRSVTKNVVKTINLFVVKCEQLTSVDGHSTQVIGPLTPSQRLNATIVDRLQTFRIKINNLLVTSNCPIDCLQLVDQSLSCIEQLMTNTMNPIISSVMDAIEAILLTMHSENYGTNSESNGDVRASEYMKELQNFIGRVKREYLSQFPDCDVTHNCTDRVANRTIELFLRHITLIRPLSQTGRMRIAADFAQLELALSPLCQPIGRLGRTYRILRSFKPLLFQSADTIAKSGAIGDLIPYSLTLELMISSSAPNDIASPHQYMSWSHSRYSTWLDQHPDEADRLALIKNCLESYVKHIRQSQGKAFASVYPILLDLLQKGIQKQYKN